MRYEKKLQIIQSFSEEELSNKILIQLFSAMEYKDIKFNHGVLEHGKDFILHRVDDFFIPRYTGIQVKAVQINTKIWNKILTQILEGLFINFIDLTDNKKKRIDNFIVITSKDITKNVEVRIVKILKGLNLDSNVSFFNGNKLISIIDNYMPEFFNKLDKATFPLRKQNILNDLEKKYVKNKDL